ncbi:hypothetical protein SAMN05421841_1839 [Chryseobacterium wanjuense]|uniref:Uncharacterized protein n=1 Tax=Chryseobacterium wanjuense TaxID=356305 RepID=A0A1I0QE51_9FLAO|nr:DUF6882 domain-containing protein [Chryseobacterium wanjuense]SEW25185.1 hypothetical protein SAMN05421841_1839 [Chryseobacterium wanjuense]
MNYEEFSAEKCQSLLHIQEQFKEKINLDSYKNWFYDGESELLRLYNSDEDEIYFRYVPIGTFSLKLRTWMWSWFNTSSIEKSKSQLLAIKEFGVQNNYEKLKEGTFPADEFDGWELSAICLHLLNGIGVYKVNSGELEKYMLLMQIENRDSPEVIKFKKQTIECGKHGYSRPAFVCQHLDLETPKGFEEAFDTEKGMELGEEDDFQAWCSDCEKIRLQHDGWNEESEKHTGITLICENCYFELKDFNLTR